MEDTMEIIKQMIANKLEIDPSTLNPASTLTEIGLDSLDTFDIIFEAEDKFNIKVPNDQVDLSTLQDVVNMLDQLIKTQHAS